jgi:hypothetical protein
MGIKIPVILGIGRHPELGSLVRKPMPGSVRSPMSGKVIELSAENILSATEWECRVEWDDGYREWVTVRLPEK